MKSLLTKISAPLLIGSILALGALALPGIARADATATLFFRSKPSVIAAVASGSGGGNTGTPVQKTAWFRAEYGDGWSFECPTAWDSATLATYKGLIDTKGRAEWSPETGLTYAGTEPAGAYVNSRAGYPFIADHSIFRVTYTSDGKTSINGQVAFQGDPRAYPPNAARDPLPCRWEDYYAGKVHITAGDVSGAMRFVPLLNVSIVYR